MKLSSCSAKIIAKGLSGSGVCLEGMLPGKQGRDKPNGRETTLPTT